MIEIFWYKELLINICKHSLVPKEGNINPLKKKKLFFFNLD